MGLTAVNYATTQQRHIGDSVGPIVKSFLATAATSYKEGDFVTVDANGRLVKATTDGQAIDGIVNASVDNSLGANDAKLVPVIVRGNVIVDGFQDISAGPYDDPFSIGGACGVSGDSGTTVPEAQAISQTAALANKQFTSLSINAIPTGTAKVVRVLAYFNGSAKFA